jgi:hypothetical protein
MNNKYRVRLYQDNIYEVVELNKLIEGQSWDGWDDHQEDVTVYKGTLADCEAWLRLNERGYM